MRIPVIFYFIFLYFPLKASDSLQSRIEKISINETTNKEIIEPNLQRNIFSQRLDELDKIEHNKK